MNDLQNKHVVEITNFPTYRLISTHTVRCDNKIVSYHRTSQEAVDAAADLQNKQAQRSIAARMTIPNVNYTAHVTHDIVNK